MIITNMKIDYVDLVLTFTGNYDYLKLTGILDDVFNIGINRDYKQISKDERKIFIFKNIHVKDFNEIDIDRKIRIRCGEINIRDIQIKYLLHYKTVWALIRAPLLVILSVVSVIGTIFSVLGYFIAVDSNTFMV